MTRTNLTARRRFVLSGLLGVAGIAANVSLRGRSCAVARKRRTQQEDPLLPEQDPHWRYLWLKRSTLMSDEPVRELVASEARRVARLAIADQVAAMERFLDRRGLLGRAERLIAHLMRSRERWKHNDEPRGGKQDERQ